MGTFFHNLECVREPDPVYVRNNGVASCEKAIIIAGAAPKAKSVCIKSHSRHNRQMRQPFILAPRIAIMGWARLHYAEYAGGKGLRIREGEKAHDDFLLRKHTGQQHGFSLPQSFRAQYVRIGFAAHRPIKGYSLRCSPCGKRQYAFLRRAGTSLRLSRIQDAATGKHGLAQFLFLFLQGDMVRIGHGNILYYLRYPAKSGINGEQNFVNQSSINFEKVYLLCKDLRANPCREMLAGGLCLP